MRGSTYHPFAFLLLFFLLDFLYALCLRTFSSYMCFMFLQITNLNKQPSNQPINILLDEQLNSYYNDNDNVMQCNAMCSDYSTYNFQCNNIWHNICDDSVNTYRDSVAEWSKACDLKSLLLRRRRFESCHCRFL